MKSKIFCWKLLSRVNAAKIAQNELCFVVLVQNNMEMPRFESCSKPSSFGQVCQPLCQKDNTARERSLEWSDWSILVEPTGDSMLTLRMKSGWISVMSGQPYRRCSQRSANAREHNLKSLKSAKFGFTCAKWCNNSTDQAWFKTESVSLAV